VLHHRDCGSAYNRKTRFLASGGVNARVVAARAGASVGAYKVFAHANAAANTFAVVLVATVLLAITVLLDYVAIIAVASVGGCRADEIHTCSFRPTSMPFTIIHIFAQHVWRRMTKAIRPAPDFIGHRSALLSADGETHTALVGHVVSVDHHCLVDRRFARSDWEVSVWATVLAIVIRTTTIPTCTVVVIVWVGNANAIM
jgi:hypothetical protein